VSQLKGQLLTPLHALYLATLGAAEALYLDERIGNFRKGKEADFVVLDASATSLARRRVSNAGDIVDRVFALILLGDDRMIARTYLMGK
jgi:guanine deaminase